MELDKPQAENKDKKNKKQKKILVALTFHNQNLQAPDMDTMDLAKKN